MKFKKTEFEAINGYILFFTDALQEVTVSAEDDKVIADGILVTFDGIYPHGNGGYVHKYTLLSVEPPGVVSLDEVFKYVERTMAEPENSTVRFASVVVNGSITIIKSRDQE